MPACRSVYAEAILQWAAPLSAVMGLMVCADAALVLARPSELEGKELQSCSGGDVMPPGASLQGTMAAERPSVGEVGGQALVVCAVNVCAGAAGPQGAGAEVVHSDSQRACSTPNSDSISSEARQTDTRAGLQARDVHVTLMT